MSRSPTKRWLAAILEATTLVAALGGALSCEAKSAQPEEPPVVAEPSSAPAPVPIDPSVLPLEALEQLEGINLAAQAPCSSTIQTLRPALESIAKHRKQLAAATTEAAAVSLLTALSAELATLLPAITPRAETDELRRISAEVIASMGDLAESLRLANEALSAQDRQASASVIRRIQNGVTNTRSSIERLIDQCAS